MHHYALVVGAYEYLVLLRCRRSLEDLHLSNSAMKAHEVWEASNPGDGEVEEALRNLLTKYFENEEPGSGEEMDHKSAFQQKAPESLNNIVNLDDDKSFLALFSDHVENFGGDFPVYKDYELVPQTFNVTPKLSAHHNYDPAETEKDILDSEFFMFEYTPAEGRYAECISRVHENTRLDTNVSDGPLDSLLDYNLESCTISHDGLISSSSAFKTTDENTNHELANLSSDYYSIMSGVGPDHRSEDSISGKSEPCTRRFRECRDSYLDSDESESACSLLRQSTSSASDSNSPATSRSHVRENLNLSSQYSKMTLGDQPRSKLSKLCSYIEIPDGNLEPKKRLKILKRLKKCTKLKLEKRNDMRINLLLARLYVKNVKEIKTLKKIIR